MKTSLFVGAAVTALLVSSSAFADKLHFVGVVAGNTEVPPIQTGACKDPLTGCAVTFTYDTVSHRLCGHALFADNLNVTAAHIHPGTPEVNGPTPIIDFGYTGETTTKNLTMDVQVADSAAQQKLVDDFNLGSGTTDPIIYFNVHTTENPSGEARGNLRAAADSDTLDDECAEIDGTTDGGTTTDAGGPTTTPTDGGGNTVTDGGSDTSTNTSDSSSSCSTAPGTSPGSIILMLGAAIAVGSIVRARKKR